jgi:transcriptional regulator, sir2 family
MNKSANQSKRKLVVLSGAGVSAESGISTFRDSDGLWESYPVQDVASIEGFRRNPQLVLDFYNARRRDYVGCKPNAAHYGLAELEHQYDVTIVTQNVDNLHEQAGSSNVIHLHGELLKNCSVHNTQKTYPVDLEHPDLHVGDLAPDGSQLRPFIVWFGEAVPMIEPAIREAGQADIMVVVGTSLNVYPAASLLAYVPTGTPIYLIDPKEVDTHGIANVTHLQEVATKGVKELLRLLMSPQR